MSQNTSKQIINVSWSPPMHGWTRLNTDDVAEINRHVACCCGVIRNINITWIVGFTRYLGHT